VLEVGAGTGRTGIEIQASGGDVFMLDYSVQSLRMIRLSAGGTPVKVVLGDARHCPFANGAFDIVLHQGLLEHFPSPYALLRENHRVLKKGGLLVVDVPQTFHLYTLMKHALMAFGLWFGGWERQFTAGSLSALLRKAGFEPVRCYGDWSRPGIIYKTIREAGARIGLRLPMYPRYLRRLTEKYYRLQARLRTKRLFLYTVLSVGVIARKA
jgi:ubiquinone/menaquinone biosynthesis C-methylase UbiE